MGAVFQTGKLIPSFIMFVNVFKLFAVRAHPEILSGYL